VVWSRHRLDKWFGPDTGWIRFCWVLELVRFVQTGWFGKEKVGLGLETVSVLFRLMGLV
jgi:hypothetical protein